MNSTRQKIVSIYGAVIILLSGLICVFSHGAVDQASLGGSNQISSAVREHERGMQLNDLPAQVQERITEHLMRAEFELERCDTTLPSGKLSLYKAINRMIQVPNALTEFRVDAVTGGIDAIGDVTIRVEKEGKTYVGRGSDVDIIVASAKAYINALNRLLTMEEIRSAPGADTPAT